MGQRGQKGPGGALQGGCGTWSWRSREGEAGDTLPHVRLTRRTSSPLAFWEPWSTSQKSSLAWSFQEKEVARLRWWPTPLVSSCRRGDTEETRSS